MNKYKILLLLLATLIAFNSCGDDDEPEGNPIITEDVVTAIAHFGDSLSFSATVTDDLPLSTLKVQLYYGDVQVSETAIRTKTNGSYGGKVYAPILKNIPEGKATIKLVAQNIVFTTTSIDKEVELTRYDYPSLTLTALDGTKYTMLRTAKDQYSVTHSFPSRIKLSISAPKPMSESNEVIFGWENGAIVSGYENPILFSNAASGTYTISFNLLTFEASPRVKFYLGGTEMTAVDDDNYKLEKNITKGEKIEVGIPNFKTWWFDPSFFKLDADGKLEFLAMSGKYRLIANIEYNYIKVERMKDNDLSTLADGGSLWVIGTKIGQPDATNNINWDATKGLCLAQIADKKFEGTFKLAAGYTFRVFHQQGLGDEFEGVNYTSHQSDLVLLAENGDFKALESGDLLDLDKEYTLSIDLTKGNNKVKMTFEERK